MKSTQQGWNTALVKQKCFALHKQCSALLEHSMNVPDRRGTLSQEKRIRGSSLKLHLSAQEGIQSQANKTAVGATTLPSGAAGNAQLPKADQQRDCKAQGHGPPRGTQQGCSSSTAPLPAPASAQQDTGRGQAKVSRTCRQQPPPAAHGRARHAALVPLTQGRAGAPPRPTFPIKSELPGATASAHHPRPRGSGRTEAGGARGTTAASSPPRTHRTRGAAGTEVKRGGGGGRRSPARHSQAEHALHVLDLPAAELLELGVGVEDGGPAGLRRALVDVVPPGQLRAQLRVRAGRQAAPLLLARLGRGRDLRFPLIALCRRPALLQQQPPLQLLRQLLRGHRPAPPQFAGRARAVRRTACPGPELYSLTRRRRAGRGGAVLEEAGRPCRRAAGGSLA